MTQRSHRPLLLVFAILFTILFYYACPVLMQQEDTIMAAAGDAAAAASSDRIANRNPQYLVLNASNFVDVKSNSSLQLAQFSVAAWFRTSEDYHHGSDTNHHFIVNKGGSGQERPGYNMNYGIWIDNRERLKGGFESLTGEDNFIVSPASYNDGKWHYAVLTFDGRTINLYVDGTKVVSKSTTATPDYTGIQPVSIGVNSLTINGFFIGGVDEVRIWNRALSDQEVKDQHSSNSGSGNFAGDGDNNFAKEIPTDFPLSYQRSNSAAFDARGLVLYLSFNS
jgi:hypothetical protein